MGVCYGLHMADEEHENILPVKSKIEQKPEDSQ